MSPPSEKVPAISCQSLYHIYFKDTVNLALAGYCLVGWSIIPFTRRVWAQFPGRAYTWVEGLTPGRGAYRRQMIQVSLSHQFLSFFLFLSHPLSKKSIKNISSSED